MSYTAPQYVDTKEQAVLALASTIKGEAVTGGDGSVNRALDILADVLAEQDVQVPQTDAGAILALAQYAIGMVKPTGTIAITENGEGIDVAQYATADVSVSGGGASVGDAVPVVYAEDAPVAESSDYAEDASFCVMSVMIGDAIIAHEDSGESTIEYVAAGCTVIVVDGSAGIKLYKCACSGTMVDAVAELTSVEVTTEDFGGGYYGHTFTIPNTLTSTDAIWITPAAD